MLSVVDDLVFEVESLAAQRRYAELRRLLDASDPHAIEADPLLRFYSILSSLQVGDIAAARTLCEASAECFAAQRPFRLYYRYLNVAGIIATNSGDLRSAVNIFTEVYDLASRARDLQLAADATMNLGVVYDILGEWDVALSSQLRALAVFSSLGDFRMVAGCQHNIGMASRQLGLVNSSRAAFEIALDLYSRHGTPDSLIGTLLERIVLYLQTEETAVAEVLLNSVESDLAATQNRKLGAEAMRVRGLVAAKRGELDAALEYFTHADRSAVELGSVLLRAEAAAGMGEVQRLRGQLAESDRLHSTAVEYYRQIGAEQRASAIEQTPSLFG